MLKSSVSDPDPNPDPPDPQAFGPPGSRSGSISQRFGSGSFYQQAKTSKKSLDSYCFVTSFGLYLLPSKSNKQKTFF
jgi:hypothetical protein